MGTLAQHWLNYMIVGWLVYFWTRTFIGMRAAVFESIFFFVKVCFPSI